MDRGLRERVGIGFAIFCIGQHLLQGAVVDPTWTELPSVPGGIGFAGPFAGVSGDSLVVAGGANFPEGPPWEGGSKVWYDDVYALEDPTGAWQAIGKLPRPLGYGVSVSWGKEIVVVGGSDAEQHYADVFGLIWDDGELTRVEGPALPTPLANMAGVLVGDDLYVAGGSESPSSSTASKGFWRLNLLAASNGGQWEALPAWPGPERILPVMAVQNGTLMLVSGARLIPDGNGGVTREFLKDAYGYDLASGEWSRLADPPASIVAAPNPGVPLGYADVLFLAGDDGEFFFRADEMRDSHPGFPVTTYRYNTVVDRWTTETDFPRVVSTSSDPRNNEGVYPPVTTTVVKWRDQFVFPSGEIRPTIRSPKVLSVTPDAVPRPFGTLNWIVLVGYLGILVAIGLRCAQRDEGTEGFFLAGRRVPWWAAGLSIFSTMLSAITYLAIPARAYATNWSVFLVNMTVFAIAPIVVAYYLPVLRKHAVTTVYEYLALRFDRSVQKFGSASFILFQTGRMGIVLLLPALALSAVTGIDLYLCIALMGVLATLYTVVGGIEAVVWTDVLQTVVLLGGAIVALGIMAWHLEGGAPRLLELGSAAGKFQIVDMEVNFVKETFLVVIIGGLFSTALVPYSSDQAVVQRYLTTRDEKEARRSLWLGAVMVLPATVLFLLLGTGLFVFFGEQPESLAPLAKADQILAWFIAGEMPAGLAGLVIAGVFAASMSSLDSSMHSMATTIVTDWWKPNHPEVPDALWLRRARIITLIAGSFGTVSALVLAGMEIQFLWDFFLGLIGLVGGTLAGVMAAGVFLPQVKTQHVWPGIVVAICVLIGVKFFTPINSLLLGFLGVMSVVGVSSLAAMLNPDSAEA